MAAGTLVVAVIVLTTVALSEHRSPAHHRLAVAPSAGLPTGHLVPPSAAPDNSGLAGIEARGDAVISQLAGLGLPIYCAGSRGREVAFTFDDGPGPYTHLALKKLTEAGERATFFVVGRSMAAFPGYLPAELRVAAIGDHTYTHPFLPALSTETVASEIGRTKQKIEQATGQPVDLFRPPYGARDAAVDAVVKHFGLLEIMWSRDSADSLGANYAGIIRNVEAGLRPGAIILMHENRGQTIRALATLLPELHRRHLRSVSLPELLASDPPSIAQVRAGRAACGPSATASTLTGS